ncbi:MAG: hypothetical protein R2825_01310 [Saprospiraceae bacterium]
MNSINWQKLGLKKNPFKIVPDKEGEKLVWAGFKENKKKFEKIITDSVSSNGSKVILVVSRYGGGKTHSSYYFSNSENIPNISDGYPSPISIIVTSPMKGNDATGELFKNIVEKIKWRNIEGSVRGLRQAYQTDAESLNVLESWTNSEDLARLLWLMGDENPDIVFLAQQAIFGQNTTSLKNTLRIRRVVSSDTDRDNALSGIFMLLANYADGKAFDTKRRIFLWIDELESLIYYTAKEYRPFTQFLRQLYDVTPNYLTMFLSFSFSDPSDFQNIEIVLGQALMDRTSTSIIFDEATIEQGKEYLSELLSKYRNDGFEGGKYSPFTEDAIDLLLERASAILEKPITPRTIGKLSLNIISEAFNQGVLYEKQIDAKFIDSIKFIED